jgi:hypothetical protein
MQISLANNRDKYKQYQTKGKRMKSFKQVISESTADLPAIEQEIISFFRRGTSTVQKEPTPSWGAVSTISSRHWGDWVVPRGAKNDGDYDWEILSKPSRKELQTFVKSLTKRHKKFSFREVEEEKNWISVHISNKK